ncbi:hypothetical protein CONCODRAFT_20392 [Conidiobolus coronatus NRRL 28638]|uniref:REM-1 domain-containing protein n=1 Tax=Conidiobolus coronatus (strain ATCC 28846 / CBS 209.66 / NRRL 28638) TaxID=796925 RepID=A0A137NTN7_CONC2|nr:hypothetical protein CONCODRAFT_20392 [Conidiobolus coronatus NRRL 28638]|eukprot:KXN66137.1 hypothetical protein CONCODRAFT_20392 [Conidiobolus coronatus NRRL 28638]
MDEDQRDRDPEIASVYNQLIIENKVKLGIQNMLQAHDTFKKGDVSNKQKMEQELITSNNKLAALTKELEIRQKLQTSKKIGLKV